MLVLILLAGIPLADARDTSKRRRGTDIRKAIEFYIRFPPPEWGHWRLDEILNHKSRGAYLLIDKHENKYAEYKLSTVYRLLSLLGWIRGYRRELSFLRSQSDDHMLNIRVAIDTLEKALADGAHVERKRLKALLGLWDYEGQIDEPRQLRLEICLEKILKNELHTQNVLLARDLPKDRQRALSKELAKALSAELNVEPPSDEVVSEMVAEAAQCLSYREAWIYRDWQAGLGDLMLDEVDSGHRKFEVIGFAEFEYMSLIGPNDDNRWIERANSIFEDLDTTGSDKYDERYNQLRTTLFATAQLLLALTRADPQQQSLIKKSIELAEKSTKPVKDAPLVRDPGLKRKQPNKRTDSDAQKGTSKVSDHFLQPLQAK